MNKVKIFIPFLVLSIFLAACKKDSNEQEEEQNPQGNYFSYNDEDYNLDGPSIIEAYGLLDGDIPNEGYNFDLLLSSSEIIFSEEGLVLADDAIGGHLLYFEMFCSNSNLLDSGVYTFDAEETYAPNTFDIGEVYMNYLPEEDEGLYTEISGGQVEVERDGSSYQITITCTDWQNNTVTGYYRGAAMNINKLSSSQSTVSRVVKSIKKLK